MGKKWLIQEWRFFSSNLHGSIPEPVHISAEKLDLIIQLLIAAVDVRHSANILLVHQTPLLELIPGGRIRTMVIRLLSVKDMILEQYK